MTPRAPRAGRKEIVGLIKIMQQRPCYLRELATLAELDFHTVRGWVTELQEQGLVRPVHVMSEKHGQAQIGWEWVR